MTTPSTSSNQPQVVPELEIQSQEARKGSKEWLTQVDGCMHFSEVCFTF